MDNSKQQPHKAKAKGGWGGARVGAQRPPLYPDEGPLVQCTVRLTHSQIARLRAMGQGNLSEGIRRALEEAGGG